MTVDVSCIVLSTFNAPFVRTHLVPSIQANSDMATTEIIVVNNGPDELASIPGASVHRSKRYHIPIGYNRGAAASTGRLLAFFHDDCVLNDPDWVDKVERALSAGAWLVGPDRRVDAEYAYLKEVPLVISRETFGSLGGYDERYYLGYQAELLCFEAVRRGGSVEVVPIDSFHYCNEIGMSTLLMLAPPSERSALAAAFGDPSFGPNSWLGLPDWPTHRLRGRWLKDYLIDLPLAGHLHRAYAARSLRDRPTFGRLLASGVLPSLMPATVGDMERLFSAIDLANRQIAAGAGRGGPVEPATVDPQ
ncbi:MAG: glycosyltransferase [Candidatus Microthrix sp.]|jgi:hypothetical protein|uniref:glycosyltransferase family 2 protein n=1 Tax=Candidatus Neomicrothrix sp. TaxID=2719034 RepID=UPI001B5F976A|nr:hypothetical protein [Candidatus Microthrix sp.]MBP7995524.1 glycosyltransferase [Candidatus Microthrix sp.]MBP9051400.1 glycosyltransferase [Ilumatobacteraceae bacterium]